MLLTRSELTCGMLCYYIYLAYKHHMTLYDVHAHSYSCVWLAKNFVMTSVDEHLALRALLFFYYVIHLQLKQQSVHVYNHWRTVVTGELMALNN